MRYSNSNVYIINIDDNDNDNDSYRYNIIGRNIEQDQPPRVELIGNNLGSSQLETPESDDQPGNENSSHHRINM